MKMAKATQHEIDTLMCWLRGKENAKFEDAKDRPPAFMRVVFGYETLVNTCCDPASDDLEWKPGYAPADTDRFRKALECIYDMPVSDQVFSSVQNIAAIALSKP